MIKNFILLCLFMFGFISYGFTQAQEINYTKDHARELQFLLKNTSPVTHLPKSFFIPKGYWAKVGSVVDNEENRNERILATYGQNIYDGATWQIAVAMMGEIEEASKQTDRLLSGKSGTMGIKAFSSEFTFGDDQMPMSKEHSFFFRMISDEWKNRDPLTQELVPWMDWKPILGENAWAALIGPLQVAYFKYNGSIPLDSPEVKLALSIIPTVRDMQSPIGGVYHTGWGVWGKNPHDISTENNASLYAGLVMLKEVLLSNEDPNKIVPRIIDPLILGIEDYFKNYAYDPNQGIFLQGGLYNDPANPNQFIPSNDFAVDVQTWGITVLGAEKVDGWFGHDTAYTIWKNTKQRGGYFDEDGVLRGVGYTDNSDKVLSVEWTLGAILLVKELYAYYGYPDLLEDALTMREGIELLKETVVIDGQKTVAFPYANKRYYIPFGWWSNKIPSLTSTAWALMNDKGFNPFILGGKKK